MSKKNNDKFDLESELNVYPYPDFVKNAFVRVVNIDNISSKSDLDKEFKKFMELKK